MAQNASFLPIFSLFFLCVLLNHGKARSVPENGGLKGMFIFGSSVVDNGNNNNLNRSLAKANYSPYGIDFASGPTGRFSDGKNVADCLAERLGLPLVPAFADPGAKGGAIVHGVNYGSGGSGILKETGSAAGQVITLDEQIDNFEKVTLPELVKELSRSAPEVLSEYVFLTAAGNNDYMLNYFQHVPPTTSFQAFAARLTSTFSFQLKRLYNLGARRLVILSVYPLGCSPVVRGKLKTKVGCAGMPNYAVRIYYAKLVDMVKQLQTQLPGSDFVVIDSIKLITDVIYHPTSHGFTDVNNACCELLADGSSCKPEGGLCPNRTSFIYFDGQHTTEALSAIFAANIYNQISNKM